VEVAITPLGSGDRISFNGFVRDITLRRKVETAMREEANLSGAMARVGYELIEALNTSDLLERLCRLTIEVLECDFSHTILLEPRTDEYVPVSGCGEPPEHWDSLRLLRLPAASLVKGLERLKRETVMSFQADSLAADDPLKRLLAHYEVSAVLFVALRRGDEVIGIQTAGHRGRREPFSAAQLRLARELAHVASLALENARLVEELQHANRLKSEFVATMSHELRTPLNVVLGYNELLLDGAVGPLSPQQTDILQRGHRSAQQLLELITATLDLSRLEAGRVEIDLSRVRLATLATEIDTEVQFMRGDKSSVAVHWNVAGNLPILLTDRAKLKLIMKNLLGNALKFTDSGHVTVTARATQGGVEIGVADTGSGIPSEALSTIFEPFRQVDGSSTRRHGGVGLGLYIVRRLVGMLGGTVRVESKEGRGSTFRVWLPQGVESTSAGNGEDVGAAEPVQAETSQGAELA
jgi:signal transduction histidine kinase